MPSRPLPDDTLSRVLDVARRLGASSDLNAVLAVVIDAMRHVLDADRATVFEYDATREELFATVAHGTGDREIRIPASTGLAGAAAQSRRIIRVRDAHADPRFNPDVDRATGYHTQSVLAIPLLADDGELVGVAQVLNKKDGVFTERDEQVAEALAAQAAVALRRQRLIADRLVREKLERDLELASRIQQGSLPATLPTLPGFQIAAWSTPAESTGEMSTTSSGCP